MNDLIITHRLRRHLILTVLSIIAVALLADRLYEYGIVRAGDLEREYTEQLREQSYALGRDYTSMLLAGDLRALRMSVEARATTAVVHRLIVTDDAGKVIASTLITDQDQPLAKVVPSFDLSSFQQAQRRNRFILRISPDHNDLYGYTPIPLPPVPGELRSTRHGMLFMHMDIAPIKAASWSHLFSRDSLLRWLVTFALGSVLLLLLINRQIFRPLEHLSLVASRLGRGDWQARSELGGNDELAHLGSAFNRMADKIQLNRRKLAARHELYQSIADHGHALIWMSGTDKLCDYYNKPWLDFTGRTLEQEYGNGWVESVHPDDLQHVNDIYVTAFDRQEVFSMEFRLRRHDGEYRWIVSEGTPRYDDQRNFLGYVGHCLDITDRKNAELELQRSEARLRTIIDTEPECIQILEAQGALIDMNAAGLSMIEADSLAQVAGMPILDLIDPDYQAAYAGMHQRVIAGEPSILEFKMVGLKGAQRWLESHSVPLREGSKTFLLSIVRDITERKQAEYALQRIQKRSETIVRAQSQFIEETDRSKAFDSVLADVLSLTDSEYGFIGEVLRTPQGDPYLKTYAISNNAWDNATRAFYAAEAPKVMELFNRRTLFGAAMTSGKPVIANAPHDDPRRGGLPEGHPELNAFLCLPVHHGREVVALIGVANRLGGYDQPLVDFLQPLTVALGQIVVAARNHDERGRFEARLQLAASVFTHAREGIMITDAAGIIVEVNDTFTDITGYSRQELLGRNPRMLQSDQQSPAFYQAMWQGVVTDGQWSGELYNRRKNGEMYPQLLTISAVRDDRGEVQNYVGLYTDISELKQHQRQLEHMAHYDALTGLPNRILLADRLQHAMNQTERRNRSIAVAYLDLDGFKAVNDTHGHEVGDELLRALSQRMNGVLREGDTLARLGGDEFVAVLVDLQDGYEPVLERLLKASSDPVMVDNAVLQLSASVGVTIYPPDSADAEQLLRHADQAMYVAKQTGKNCYHLFDIEHDTAVQAQRENVEKICRALDLGEFVLYYQPKVNMKTGGLIGAEALIRWQHPERGLLLPAEFLPIVENHPISVRLGEWVIDAALKQMSEWRSAGLRIQVSVNIGSVQLQQHDFATRVSALLAVHPDIEPAWLEFEVLETSALANITQIAEIIQACRTIGVRFALDDFGAGYSSLTYLRRLPTDMLKIDQSFVRDILDDPDDLAIVNAIIGLSRAFNRQVIAEGVETISHGVKLLEMGCYLAQGYAIARPMPAASMAPWLANWKPDEAWADDQPFQGANRLKNIKK